MSVLRNLYARSEQWRLEWGFRTCVSVALVSFLCLYPPTRERFTRFGVSGFALVPVTTVFVKDLTLGQTLVNGWFTIFGAFLGSLLAWIIFQIYRQVYENYLPLWLLLVTEFVIAFLLQYSEMVLVARKFAICVFAINLIANRENPEPDFRIWGLFISICLGTGCAYVGCFVPLPVRLAGTELKERVLYYSEAMAALVEDITESWVHTHKPRATNNINRKSILRKRPVEAAGAVVEAKDGVTVPDAGGSANGTELRYIPEENPHWRRLRLHLTTVAAFQRYSRPRCYNPAIGTDSNPCRREHSTRVLRQELMSYLVESLVHLQNRNTEAKFGPSRRMALRCLKYVKLVQDVLLIIARLEIHVENMEKRHKYHFVYETFFARPNFQYAVTLYGRSLSEMILSISHVLEVVTSLDSELLPPCPESFAAVAAAARLIKARAYFDSEYLLARRDIFYPEQQSMDADKILSPRTERMRAFTSVSDVEPHRLRAGTGEGRPRTGSLHTVGIRTYSKAMMDVHSTVFLMDTLSRLLLEFWPQDDLARLSRVGVTVPHDARHVRAEKQRQSCEEGEIITSDDQSDHSAPTRQTSPTEETLKKFCVGLGRFLIEILPTKQSHLLPFTVTSDWRLQWAITPALWQRFVSALTVAAAIALGAWYGIVAERPSPALPSFTIAFLAGGAVSGINVMTCINRAAGTAVACVYAVLVAYIISDWNSEAARDCFLALAVIALQVPACYVRSFPLYSYSGTVTGFTVAMILLTSNATTAVAVNRIIDTYVAVAIYLVMEFLVSATFTEEEIFRDMRQVFEGIEDKFINFNRNFHFFKAAEDTFEEVKTRIRGGTLTQMEMAVELHRIEQLREDVRVRHELEVGPMQEVIKRQRQLAPFYRSEPAVFRPAAFPAALLQESIELQEQAVNSIQIMIWAVKACDGTFSDQVELLVDKVHRKLQASLAQQQRSRAQQAQAHSTPRKNPFLGPQGGDVEMATLSHSEEAKDNDGRSTPASADDTGAVRPLSTPPSVAPLRPPQPATHSRRPSTNSASSLAGRVVPILPEFKTLLLPLEPHFVEVQKFVSAVLISLSSAMDGITDWKPTLRAFYAPSTDLPLVNAVFGAIGKVLWKCKDSSQRRRDRLAREGAADAGGRSEDQRRRAQQEVVTSAVQRASGALGKLTALTQARHAAQLRCVSGESPPQGLPIGEDEVFHTDHLHELYLSYQALVEDLQRSLTSDVHASAESADQHSDSSGSPSKESPEDRDSQPQPHLPRRIPSNREVVIVNTLLASTQQLIAALHGLTTLVSRLQAHRDIRVTQDGKNA